MAARASLTKAKPPTDPSSEEREYFVCYQSKESKARGSDDVLLTWGEAVDMVADMNIKMPRRHHYICKRVVGKSPLGDVSALNAPVAEDHEPTRVGSYLPRHQALRIAPQGLFNAADDNVADDE